MNSADQIWIDELDDYLNARVLGTVASAGAIDPSAEQTVTRFFDDDDTPAPPRDLYQQIWEDLMDQTANAGTTAPVAVIRQPVWEKKTHPPVRGWPVRLPRPVAARSHWRIAQLAATILLLVAVGFGYRALDPFGSDPENPSSIPAAVAPVATPEATPISRVGHPLIGAWQMEWRDGPYPTTNTSYVIFDADGTFVLSDKDPNIAVGSWNATGDTTADLVFISQSPISFDFLFADDYALPTTLTEGAMGVTKLSIVVSDDGSYWVGTGFSEPMNLAGDVLVHLVHDESEGNLVGTRLVPITDEPVATPIP